MFTWANQRPRKRSQKGGPLSCDSMLMPWPRTTSKYLLDHSLAVVVHASENTAQGYCRHPWRRELANSPSLWGMSPEVCTQLASGLTERALCSPQEPVWLIYRKPGLKSKDSQQPLNQIGKIKTSALLYSEGPIPCCVLCNLWVSCKIVPSLAQL